MYLPTFSTNHSLSRLCATFSKVVTDGLLVSRRHIVSFSGSSTLLSYIPRHYETLKRVYVIMQPSDAEVRVPRVKETRKACVYYSESNLYAADIAFQFF
jgi:hypothetical protein